MVVHAFALVVFFLLTPCYFRDVTILKKKENLKFQIDTNKIHSKCVTYKKNNDFQVKLQAKKRKSDRKMMNSSVIKTERSVDRAHFCVKCDKQIQDRYFLKALNAFWHENCLKCSCCDCRLADVGATLFTRENVILCKSDYIR